ncbi:MAG: TonB-system energizer ExbB [Gammaproteobacteria bacterium]|nr:TonB-system energizer ExbB [Gammaproteobacteria bacterium]
MEFLKSWLDIGVFGILGLMSVVALACVIERFIHYGRVQVERYPHPESLRLDLNRGLTTIASVASNAPYVGLLGTVFGIMLTFYEIGQSGQIDTRSVMVGLALALKATALGLLVAIPAMMFYNALVAKSEALMSRWKIVHEPRQV